MTPDDPTPPRPSNPIFPADPRLTAYAFGELEGEDLALIEAALANDETLRALVDELRAFGGDLTNSLAAEIESENKNENKNGSAVSETTAVTPALALTHAFADKAALTKRFAEPKCRGVFLRFPFALSYLAPALAACLAVVFWIRHDSEHPNHRGPIPPVALSREVADAMPFADGANFAGVTSSVKQKMDAVPSAAPENISADAMPAPVLGLIALEPQMLTEKDVRADAPQAAFASPQAPVARVVNSAKETGYAPPSARISAKARALPRAYERDEQQVSEKVAVAGQLSAQVGGNYVSGRRSHESLGLSIADRADETVVLSEWSYFNGRLFGGSYLRTTAIPSANDDENRKRQLAEIEQQNQALRHFLRSAMPQRSFFMLTP